MCAIEIRGIKASKQIRGLDLGVGAGQAASDGKQ